MKPSQKHSTNGSRRQPQSAEAKTRRVGARSKDGTVPDQRPLRAKRAAAPPPKFRKAKTGLLPAHDRYAALYDHAPVSQVSLDHRGVVRALNRAAALLLRREPEQLLNRPLRIHVAPADHVRFRAHLRQLRQNTAPVITELRLILPGQNPLPVELKSVPGPAPDGPQVWGHSTLIDLAERRKSEPSLRESAELNQGILASLTTHIAVLDSHGTIVAVNQAWNRFASDNGNGHPTGTGVGSNYLGVCRKALSASVPDSPTVLAGIQGVLAGTRSGFSLEYPCHSPTQRRWFQMSVTPLSGGLRGAVVSHADISERRRAEESLRDERDFVSAVLETAGALVIVMDGAGRIVRFNRACEQLTGHSAAGVLGRSIWNLLIPPEEVASVRAEFEKLKAGQLPSRLENCWLTKSGQRRLIEWSNTVLPKADGSVRHIIGTGLDITSRQRDDVRRHLHYETAHLLATSSSLADAVPKILAAVAGAFDWDIGEFWAVQPGAQSLRVIHVWHKPGRKLAAFVKQSRQLSLAIFDGLPGRVLASEKPQWIPDVTHWPDFKRKDLAAKAGLRSALALPVLLEKDPSGVMAFLSHRLIEPDDDLLALFASLGSQIGQFMERRKAEAALREAHEFGRQVIGGAGAGIIVYDHQARVVVWNPFMEQLSGVPAPDVIGRSWNQLPASLHDERFPEKYARALNGETFDGADTTFEIPTKGIRGWKAERFAPMRNSTGEIAGVIVAVRDVTERKRLEDEILGVSERERRQFGQDLHDGLGQRLTGLEMLSHDLAEQIAGLASPLTKPARRLNRELRATVTQARLISHSLAPVPLDGNGLMHGLAELAASTSRLPGVRCRFLCHPPVAINNVTAATHLYRIAQEAVNNGLKHGGAGRIDITLTPRANGVELAVENNGLPLRTTPRPRPGIGLNLMHYRAEMIGAKLAIESGQRRGVRITCRWPTHS